MNFEPEWLMRNPEFEARWSEGGVRAARWGRRPDPVESDSLWVVSVGRALRMTPSVPPSFRGHSG